MDQAGIDGCQPEDGCQDGLGRVIKKTPVLIDSSSTTNRYYFLSKNSF